MMIERLRNYRNLGPALLLALGAVALLARPTTTSSACWPASSSIRCSALGLNVVVGFAGLLDIGYVAFFGIGSYIYAFLASPHFGLHLPFSASDADRDARCRYLWRPDRCADAQAARRLPRDRDVGLRRDYLHLPRQPRPSHQHHGRPERTRSRSIRRRSSATSSSATSSTITCSSSRWGGCCWPACGCGIGGSAGRGRRSGRMS